VRVVVKLSKKRGALNLVKIMKGKKTCVVKLVENIGGSRERVEVSRKRVEVSRKRVGVKLDWGGLEKETLGGL